MQLSFGAGSSPSVTIPAGGDAYSNPVALPGMSGSGDLTVSMHVMTGKTVTLVPIHQSVEGLTTYYASGDDTGNSDGTPFTSSLQGLYYLAGLDVSDTTISTTTTSGNIQYTGTVAVLGDQEAVNAPAGSTVNWPADLPAALGAAAANVAGSIVDASTSDSMPDDWWRLNGGGPDSGATAYDGGAAGTNSLTLKGNAPTWSTSGPGTGTSSGSLELDGSTQYGISPTPATAPSGSFAVSAWVNLSAVAAGDAVAIARDGSSASEFYLGTHDGDWGFWFTGTDAPGPALTGAYGAAATTGTWTLLTGVYDSGARQIMLYINGAEAATTSFSPPWTAAGPFTVGSGLAGGSQTDFMHGYVSDVRYYNRMLNDYNVSAIYNDTGMSSLTAEGVASTMVSDKPGSSGLLDYAGYAEGEPNLRDVIVSLGANDVLEGESEGTIENSLRTIVTAIAGWPVADDPAVGAHAFVTTIPPLGLSATDARETVREDVNSWLLGNPGATANLAGTVPVLDLASGVAQPGSVNDINSSYLSGGVPTSAYYQQAATTVANAISAWLAGPPPVTW